MLKNAIKRVFPNAPVDTIMDCIQRFNIKNPVDFVRDLLHGHVPAGVADLHDGGIVVFRPAVLAQAAMEVAPDFSGAAVVEDFHVPTGTGAVILRVTAGRLKALDW